VSQLLEEDAMTTTPETAATTLARFDDAWAALEATVTSLDERDLTEIRDPAGWSAKDHLMHVALWEQALLAKLDGRLRHEALGIDEATDRSGDDDTINAAIFARTRHRPLPEVLDAVRTTHAAARARLRGLVDAAGGGAAEPTVPDAASTLLVDVPGYTEHYAQHHTWIRDLVARRAP
jgi:DinB family protein